MSRPKGKSGSWPRPDKSAKLWQAVAQLLHEEALHAAGNSGRMNFSSEAAIPDDLWVAAVVVCMAEDRDLQQCVTYVSGARHGLLELRNQGLEPHEIASFITGR